MFRGAFSKGYVQAIRNRVFSYCDNSVDVSEDESLPSLVEQADATLEKDRPKLRTPTSYENLRNTFQGANVSTFDGFRCAVQKQVNLNTVVTHFYWIGSQNVPPMYQYRIILPFDDGKFANVATDVDLSTVDAEFKYPITSKILAKLNISIPQESPQTAGELEISEDSSFTTISVAKTNDIALTVSYMQMVTPFLTFGGIGTYSLKAQNFTRGWAGMYQDGENTLALQWEKDFRLLYQRKVNPNRVHLSADLQVDDAGNSQVAVGAEYILKQSKLHMSIDSNLQLKSTVETQIAPGVTLQFSSDMMHLQNGYRFGFGITMG